MAAMLRMRQKRARPTPRQTVWAMLLTVLARPKACPVRLWFLIGRAYPLCRAGRLLIAEYLNFSFIRLPAGNSPTTLSQRELTGFAKTVRTADVPA